MSFLALSIIPVKGRWFPLNADCLQEKEKNVRTLSWLTLDAFTLTARGTLAAVWPGPRG